MRPVRDSNPRFTGDSDHPLSGVGPCVLTSRRTRRMWWRWRESNPRPNSISVASYSHSGAARTGYAPAISHADEHRPRSSIRPLAIARPGAYLLPTAPSRTAMAAPFTGEATRRRQPRSRAVVLHGGAAWPALEPARMGACPTAFNRCSTRPHCSPTLSYKPLRHEPRLSEASRLTTLQGLLRQGVRRGFLLQQSGPLRNRSGKPHVSGESTRRG